MIVGIQSLTLKWISKVFSLKLSLQFRGCGGLSTLMGLGPSATPRHVS